MKNPLKRLFEPKKTEVLQWSYTMLPMLPNEEDESPKPWEYIDMINSMGKSGWELVGISFNTLIFKRPNVTLR